MKPYEEFLLKLFSKAANRHYEQALYLYRLCDEDLGKYMALEYAIKYNGIRQIPSSLEEVDQLLAKTTFDIRKPYPALKVSFEESTNPWRLLYLKDVLPLIADVELYAELKEMRK